MEHQRQPGRVQAGRQAVEFAGGGEPGLPGARVGVEDLHHLGADVQRPLRHGQEPARGGELGSDEGEGGGRARRSRAARRARCAAGLRAAACVSTRCIHTGEHIESGRRITPGRAAPRRARRRKGEAWRRSGLWNPTTADRTSSSSTGWRATPRTTSPCSPCPGGTGSGACTAAPWSWRRRPGSCSEAAPTCPTSSSPPICSICRCSSPQPGGPAPGCVALGAGLARHPGHRLLPREPAHLSPAAGGGARPGLRLQESDHGAGGRDRPFQQRLSPAGVPRRGRGTHGGHARRRAGVGGG